MGVQDVTGEVEGTSRQVESRFEIPEWVFIVGIILLLLYLFSMYKSILGRPHGTGLSQTTSNAKQLGTNFYLYSVDYDDVFPPVTHGALGAGKVGGWVYYSRFGINGAGSFDVSKGVLFPYAKSTLIFLSGSDPDALLSGNSFALNGFITNPFRPGLSLTKPLSEIKNSTTTMLLGEEATFNPMDHSVHGTNDGYFDLLRDHFTNRNGGKTVVVLADGHAKTIDTQEKFIETICGSAEDCIHPKAGRKQ